MFIGLISVSDTSSILMRILSILAIFRLFDLLVGLGRIIFIEREQRLDTQGHYLLVRDVSRWTILTFLHLIEISLYFGILYLKNGHGFDEQILDWITAIYQSVLTFTTLGYGEIHAHSSYAKILVILHLFYFMAFVLLIIPFIFSAIRAKERTSEVFGNTDFPDM